MFHVKHRRRDARHDWRVRAHYAPNTRGSKTAHSRRGGTREDAAPFPFSPAGPRQTPAVPNTPRQSDQNAE